MSFLEEIGDIRILDKAGYRISQLAVEPGEPFVGEVTAKGDVYTIYGPKVARKQHKHEAEQELSFLEIFEEYAEPQ
jgi:hypothetical protein